jgi:hypothetical protein
VRCCRPGSGALAPREGKRRVRTGVLSCTVRLSRLREQPLAPPDMDDATRRSVDDRVKQCFASSLRARGKVFDL